VQIVRWSPASGHKERVATHDILLSVALAWSE